MVTPATTINIINEERDPRDLMDTSMAIKVVKFGGSSLADAKQIQKAAAIIQADPQRRYVVPSAPGKRFSGDTKVTDMLYACYALAEAGVEFQKELEAIQARYDDIIAGLGIQLSLADEFAVIAENFRKRAGKDYAASRGEYLNGKVIAAYLGFPFVDAADVIFFQPNGSLDDQKTEEALRARLTDLENAVIPGFYGCGADGYVKTFSRGGSDVTGSIVAGAVKAALYENWTDVSGILMADPRIVDDPEPIRRVTYSELRELSYIGAQVLHEGTIFPVREKNIPLNIRNTNDPEHPGTTILESIEEDTNDGSFITGIAGKKGFSVITIAKTGMSGDPGTLVRILEILAKHEVNVEYIPSGIDIISLVVESKKVSKCLYAMLGELQKEVQPNKITVTEHIAVVAAVGRKMAYRPGVSGKIFAKLGENGVNIRMITQGPEELNIIVGVEEKDFAQAIRVLYDSFVKEHI